MRVNAYRTRRRFPGRESSTRDLARAEGCVDDGHGNARAVARLYRHCRDGELDGVHFLSGDLGRRPRSRCTERNPCCSADGFGLGSSSPWRAPVRSQPAGVAIRRPGSLGFGRSRRAGSLRLCHESGARRLAAQARPPSIDLVYAARNRARGGAAGRWARAGRWRDQQEPACGAGRNRRCRRASRDPVEWRIAPPARLRAIASMKRR